MSPVKFEIEFHWLKPCYAMLNSTCRSIEQNKQETTWHCSYQGPITPADRCELTTAKQVKSDRVTCSSASAPLQVKACIKSRDESHLYQCPYSITIFNLKSAAGISNLARQWYYENRFARPSRRQFKQQVCSVYRQRMPDHLCGDMTPMTFTSRPIITQEWSCHL